MAQTNDYDEVTANQATGFSEFGGHLLTSQKEMVTLTESGSNGNGYFEILASLGIADVEQLVAIAAIPQVRKELEAVLHLADKEFKNLISQVQNGLPPDRLSLVSVPAPAEFGLGVLAPTPEMLAAAEAYVAEEAIEAVNLPSAINLIPYMSPIRNQAARGTCVSFALTSLNEYILRRRGFVRDLSEQHLYYETKLIDGAPNSCGTWQMRAVLALLNRGQCLETLWPYRPALPCNNHGPLPAQARPNGLSHRLTTLSVPARSVASYKQHLSLQRPVTLSFPVYNSWYQSAETRRSGRITMRIGNEAVVGGHAVCLVGYQDTPTSPGGGFFIVRNSWGTTAFGASSPYGPGYGTIPYQYITNDAYVSETFTAAVPGIGSGETLEDELADAMTQKSSVTIDVSPNIKITIANG